MSTTPINYSTGLTFEQVWAMFKETDKKFQETDKKFLAMEERMEKSKKEIDEQIEKVSRSIGELGNRFGELAEHLVAPGIAERFNELGYHFDGVAKGGLEISENGRVVTEVDILLENEKTIA
ncbi:MAG: DUF3782 domain-containing protein, partial [Planctomycetaceae bacterium]|nr:DUF3782 domain-containing protein [Planctomycetaceae bacterium]